jgi:hypothetical protein
MFDRFHQAVRSFTLALGARPVLLLGSTAATPPPCPRITCPLRNWRPPRNRPATGHRHRNTGPAARPQAAPTARNAHQTNPGPVVTMTAATTPPGLDRQTPRPGAVNQALRTEPTATQGNAKAKGATRRQHRPREWRARPIGQTVLPGDSTVHVLYSAEISAHHPVENSTCGKVSKPRQARFCAEKVAQIGESLAAENEFRRKGYLNFRGVTGNFWY